MEVRVVSLQDVVECPFCGEEKELQQYDKRDANILDPRGRPAFHYFCSCLQRWKGGVERAVAYQRTCGTISLENKAIKVSPLQPSQK